MPEEREIVCYACGHHNLVTIEEDTEYFSCVNCHVENNIEFETQEEVKSEILNTIREKLKSLNFAKKSEESFKIPKPDWKALNDSLDALTKERIKKLDLEIANLLKLQQLYLTEISKCQKLSEQLEDQILKYNSLIDETNKRILDYNRRM